MGELRFRHSLANSRLRNIAIEKIRYFSSMELSFEWTEDELILIYSSEMSITDVQKLEEMTELESLQEENERLRTEVAYLTKLRELRLRDEALALERQKQLEKWARRLRI